MKTELDKQLCEKYPLVFKNRHESMQTTAMCWGFECGDGWYNIIDTLCGLLTSEYRSAKSQYDYIFEKLGQPKYGFKADGSPSGDIVTQEMLDKAKQKMEEAAKTVPVAAQVKEKFGGLRFYVHAATPKHFDYITFAESMSYRTCEVCGSPGKPYTDGWHVTLCDIHAEMHGNKQEYEAEENE